jgi:hypothetical protein
MRQRFGIALIAGLILVLFVSACGVALTPVQFASGGPGFLSPIIIGVHGPDLQPAALNSMHELQRWQSLAQRSPASYGVASCHGDF